MRSLKMQRNTVNISQLPNLKSEIIHHPTGTIATLKCVLGGGGGAIVS
jgi:hypothetical protein